MAKQLTQKDVERLLVRQSKYVGKLLGNQTKIILDAVDERIARGEKYILDAVDKRIEKAEQRILLTVDGMIDQKIKASEERINAKLDQLITTLDKFLKRLADLEDEFTIMKEDLNRVKRVVRDKLGVDLL